MLCIISLPHYLPPNSSDAKYNLSSSPSFRSPDDCTRSVHDTDSRYRDKESDYWEAKIASDADRSRRLWTSLNAFLGRGQPVCSGSSIIHGGRLQFPEI